MKYVLTTLMAFCLYMGHASAQTETEVLEGSFESKRGVMSPVSCHGFNIGYLQTGDTRRIVCFDRLKGGEDLNIDCEKNVWVTGYTEQHTVKANGACPGDEKNVFFVTEWHCQ